MKPKRKTRVGDADRHSDQDNIQLGQKLSLLNVDSGLVGLSPFPVAPASDNAEVCA